MKSAIIAVCVFACAFAASVDQEASVVKYSYEQNPDNGFSYFYETSNNIAAQTQGKYKSLAEGEVALEVKGSNQYTDPSGQVIQISYVADENGYRAEGAHLPTPPAPEPIPDYILKAIDYIKAHSTTEKNF